MVDVMTSMERRRRRGFTMIEVMIALAVLLVAAVGALTGLLSASKDLKMGQQHVYQSILVEATVQRLRLTDKKVLLDYAVGQLPYPPPPATTGANNPTTAVGWSMTASPVDQAIDAAPWGTDPWSTATGAIPDSFDLSTGKFFTILPSGEITPVPVSTLPLTTPCLDPAVPVGTFCREVAIIPSGPTATPPPISAAGFRTATVWIRVSQKGAPLNRAVVAREVIAQ